MLMTDLIQEIISLYWLGRPVEANYQALVRLYKKRREHALGALVYGQLLMSRKLSGALDHLQAGFELGRPYFTAAEYFTVYRRHRLLEHLPLQATASPPHDLQSLLNQAAVIQRLRNSLNTPRNLVRNPADTVG
jgi:hypothetical protein